MNNKILSEKELENYVPGKGCCCAASCWSECCCEEHSGYEIKIDWTPREVYELRLENDKLDKRICELESYIDELNSKLSDYEYIRAKIKKYEQKIQILL